MSPHSGAQDLEALASFKALVFRPTMFSAMLIIRKIAVFLRNAFVLFSRESVHEFLIFVKETDCFVCDAGTEVVNVI